MTNPERECPESAFCFTERERFSFHVTHERFQALLADEQTTIHQVELSANDYGEFLFVTVSRPMAEERSHLTCWGLGLHEQRERWLIEVWFWHRTFPAGNRSENVIDKETAVRLINQRQAEIAPFVRQNRQSKRGELFEMLADLTDDDAARAELEDLRDALLDDSDLEF